jgi:hypothetical protein
MFRLKPNMLTEFGLILDKIKKGEAGMKLVCAQVTLSELTKRKYRHKKVFSQPKETSSLFWQFIDKTFLTRLNDSNYMIYVTSDSEAVKHDA